jgi:CrcB protein
VTHLDVLWAGLAGGAGAASRYVLDAAIHRRIRSAVPVGIVAINISGSLVLGVLAGMVLFHHAPAELTVVAGAGFCGGFTTFSTTSFTTVRLLQRGQLAAAALNAGVTLGGALAAAAAGFALASL